MGARANLTKPSGEAQDPQCSASSKVSGARRLLTTTMKPTRTFLRCFDGRTAKETK